MMLRKAFLLLVLLLPLSLLSAPAATPVQPETTTQVASYQRPLAIRLLVLKHSREYMADGDANLAIQAVKAGADKGLGIKNIGNHYFTDPVNGRVANTFTTILMNPDPVMKMQKFQEFVSAQMKIDAKPHDTLIIFTIGHGGQGGGLHNIGQRSDVMRALAAAAEENKQQVVWWQLSCHATARLPALATLPPNQQKLFSMIASSVAEQESVADLQGRIMNKLFVALAEKNRSIDPDQDGLITAKELDSFLRSPGIPRQGGGPIVISLQENTLMFGYRGLDIRIVDRIGPQGQYPDEYIPIPD